MLNCIFQNFLNYIKQGIECNDCNKTYYNCRCNEYSLYSEKEIINYCKRFILLNINSSYINKFIGFRKISGL